MIRMIFLLSLFLFSFLGCKKNNVNVTPQPPIIHEEVGTIESHHIVYDTNTTLNHCICNLPFPEYPELKPVNPILIQINNQSYVCYTLNDSYIVMQNILGLYFYAQQLEDYLNHICNNQIVGHNENDTNSKIQTTTKKDTIHRKGKRSEKSIKEIDRSH